MAGGHALSRADAGTWEGQASPDACEQDARYCYRYYLTPTCVAHRELKEPSLGELARVIKAGACIEASFKRGKGEAGMDEYQVRTWEGWHHHMALTLIAVWFLIEETHRGQQWTPALTLPQVRYGLSVLLLEVFCTPRRRLHLSPSAPAINAQRVGPILPSPYP